MSPYDLPDPSPRHRRAGFRPGLRVAGDPHTAWRGALRLRDGNADRARDVVAWLFTAVLPDHLFPHQLVRSVILEGEADDDAEGILITAHEGLGLEVRAYLQAAEETVEDLT